MEAPDSHLVAAMAEVYAKCRMIKGRAGGPKDRVRKFEQMMGGVWLKAHEGLSSQLTGILNQNEEELNRVIRDFFIDIDKKFNMMCSDKELEDDEETQLRGKLKENLVLAKEMFEQKVRPAAVACFGNF